MRLLTLWLAIFLGGSYLLVAVPATATESPNVVAQNDGSFTRVNAENDHRDGHKDPVNPASSEQRYPVVTHTIVAECGPEGDQVLCVVTWCPDGKRRFVQRVERIEHPGAAPVVSFEEACGGSPEVDLAALAMREFYQTKMTIPAPVVHPDGDTLVNFPNVYSTTFREFDKPTSIRTAVVRLRFTPRVYRWVFGDGESMATPGPGKPYDPELTDRVGQIEQQYPVTHRYRHVGNYAVTVTITFDGDFAVNGGPWQPIPGALQATSAARTVSVDQARARLVKPPSP